MRRFRFTKPSVAALKPEARRYDVYDDSETRGLVVTVTPNCAKSYYLIRKVRGQVQRVRLGRVKDLAPDQARKRAALLNAEIAEGKSPAEERRAVRAEMTLGELWALFVARHGPKKRSLHTDELRYAKHLSHWSGRKLSTIARADVVRLLDGITATSGPGASNRARALLHCLFAKAATWGADVRNPVTGTARNREHAKERYLSPDELRRFLAAVEADHDDYTKDFLRLLLFTGVRRGTLAAARWEEFALADALWRIPGEHMKAGRPLEVPLAPAAAAILRDRQARAVPGAAWVFPGRGRDGHVVGAEAGWKRVSESARISGVTLHDLRRTLAVYAMESGVQLAVIAKVLGHAPVGGVTAVYARPTPAQVRAAVERTVAHMLAVATGSAEVIPFVAAGGGR